MNLQKITNARWFPTVTKPLLAGLMTMGLLYGLRALGVTSFTSWEINNAVTPVAGLLVAAIVTKPTPGKPKPSATDQMKQLALQVAHEELANNPELVKQLAGAAFKDVLSIEQPATLEKAVLQSPQAQEETTQGFVA